MKNVTASEILYQAAHLIAAGIECYCCAAIAHATRQLTTPDDNEYLQFIPVYRDAITTFRRFRPQDYVQPHALWGPDFTDESQAERVLALLFAAEVAKDEQ